MNICIFIADIHVADYQRTRRPIGDNLIVQRCRKIMSMGVDCGMLTPSETAMNDMFLKKN